ncbi:hypothetical protein L2734_00360 [Parashewanella spongiae]|nr:hypothetical protein [Parashewanella spongiae]MCL1076636.1 hypothetical protein [Parashewanella spongiae]
MANPIISIPIKIEPQLHSGPAEDIEPDIELKFGPNKAFIVTFGYCEACKNSMSLSDFMEHKDKCEAIKFKIKELLASLPTPPYEESCRLELIKLAPTNKAKFAKAMVEMNHLWKKLGEEFNLPPNKLQEIQAQILIKSVMSCMSDTLEILIRSGVSNSVFISASAQDIYAVTEGFIKDGSLECDAGVKVLKNLLALS